MNLIKHALTDTYEDESKQLFSNSCSVSLYCVIARTNDHVKEHDLYVIVMDTISSANICVTRAWSQSHRSTNEATMTHTRVQLSQNNPKSNPRNFTTNKTPTNTIRKKCCQPNAKRSLINTTKSQSEKTVQSFKVKIPEHVIRKAYEETDKNEAPVKEGDVQTEATLEAGNGEYGGCGNRESVL